MKYFKGKTLMFGAVFAGSFSLLYFAIPSFVQVVYDDSVSQPSDVSGSASTTAKGINIEAEEKKEPVFVVTHIKTPNPLKGVYMSACVSATPSIRRKIVSLIEETELNAVVIDIKDYTGTVSFKSGISHLEASATGGGCRASDMREFIGSLHDKGIYVIGRIAVFQDPYFTKIKPEFAVKKNSDRSLVWRDFKGLSFVDAGAREFWEYIVDISKTAYLIGFDEINYDYIRFPSDGNMNDIYYPKSESSVVANPRTGKAEVIRDFSKYLRENVGITGAVLSADLFGMTMTNTDDLNIGQILEYVAPYFDYIAPMVYPSHYPKGFNEYQNVNNYPYEIVKYSMDKGTARMLAASSTPNKLRPWLQDNDYPVHYTPEMVRTQIQATYDAGLTSWMLWDAGNTYTRAALEEE